MQGYDEKLSDFQLGYRDRVHGFYDKWYRYNRADDGAEYDRGCVYAINCGDAAESVQIIEADGCAS